MRPVLRPCALGARAARLPALRQDEIDLTGQQNVILGSGARAFGMGGAFLARADDATAASWNPAGLSYLRAARAVARGRAQRLHDRRAGVDTYRFTGSSVGLRAP